MSADYVLEYPCSVRKEVPEDKLVTLVGYMRLAQFSIGRARASEPEVSIEAILSNYEVRVTQERPDGTASQVPMTVGQLLELAQPVRPYSERCKDCRANVSNCSFGCIGRINYPIKREAEEWLLSRLPSDIGNQGLSLLCRFLVELEVDGRPVDKLRDRLFELQAPLVRRWGTLSAQQQISSSQILQMLLAYDKIVPEQAIAYTNILGLTSVLSDPHPPSSNIEQFKTFMCAVVMSGRLGAVVRIES